MQISRIRLNLLKLLTVLLAVPWCSFARQTHPKLFLTQQEARLMRESLGKYSLFDSAFNSAKERVDRALNSPIDVPVPQDVSGYTHSRHTQNRTEMHVAGVMYAVTLDEKYARFVRDMLFKYADLYPSLRKHPKAKGEAYGKLFWQTLNETVWLVHAAQAYDCIYDWLTPKDRKHIEDNVFRPMTAFFTVEHAEEHDRIHNHGTWTVAAVGMAGLVMNDTGLVNMALYGTKKNKEGGFIRQLELLFSPDGYYMEGPYYARYALMPFFSFAQALDNSRPEMRIFEMRDGLLGKALHSALQLTAPTGEFFPFNDAIKGMNLEAPEIVLALDLVYQRYGEDRTLLSIAKRQNSVLLNGAGLLVARALANETAIKQYPLKSVEFTDGPNGDEGGVGVLRHGGAKDQMALVMKYTAHGQSHGHYDKLGMFYYDQSREVIQDYGSARFINVEPKDGGRYLAENKSFAMQTIAHNTVTVDGQSHYQGKIALSEQRHANRHFFSASDSTFQVMSATVLDAYEGVRMQRTLALVTDPIFRRPIVIDVVRIVSDSTHQYDLPVYYLGQHISTNVKYISHMKEQKPLGSSNGYQHLWNEAEGNVSSPLQFTWLTGKRYYTMTSSGDSSTQVFFARIGSSDPSFNLRTDPAVVLRQIAKNHIFASVLEPHGEYDEAREYSVNPSGSITSVKVVGSTDAGTVVEISGKKGLKWQFMISNGPESSQATHTVSTPSGTYSWTGNSNLRKFK
jgi:hypothetical protein